MYHDDPFYKYYMRNKLEMFSHVTSSIVRRYSKTTQTELDKLKTEILDETSMIIHKLS